jgi:hypothetical protein
VTDDVREMGMEHKSEISQRFGHEVLLYRPVEVGGKNQIMGESKNLTLTIRSQIIRVKGPRC